MHKVYVIIIINFTLHSHTGKKSKLVDVYDLGGGGGKGKERWRPVQGVKSSKLYVNFGLY